MLGCKKFNQELATLNNIVSENALDGEAKSQRDPKAKTKEDCRTTKDHQEGTHQAYLRNNTNSTSTLKKKKKGEHIKEYREKKFNKKLTKKKNIG